MPEPLVRLQNVSHTFPDGLIAVHNTSFDLFAGQFVSLVGQSGVGKSTVLRIVAGLTQPTTGTVLRENGVGQVGVVFQNHNLMPWRTVAANIALPLEIAGLSAADSAERVAEMVALVGLSGFEASYPAQLSGGMAQRVALGRALVSRPSLLLLDEPFGALDALTRERMGQELLRIHRAHPVTVLMVTHSIPEAVLLSDSVLVMSGHPGTVSAELHIPIPRPRHATHQQHPAFFACADQIRHAL